jgi:UDP-N-acetyl-D-mannosaminuronate dehydrogenase
MKNSMLVVVVGLGEVGTPLLELVGRHYDVIGVDISPFKAVRRAVDVLHICYPFQINDFVVEAKRYIDLFHPKLTIINSSVPIGTTRQIALRTGASVAHSPIRGKHTCMLSELLRYAKFVGALDHSTAEQATSHFESLGMKTRILSSPESTELAKLVETSYFGLLIAWAQDIERACDKLEVSYDEVVSFYEEIGFFPPVKYFPGVIGGHCVMPNIELLGKAVNSEILEAIRLSNKAKIKRDSEWGKAQDLQGVGLTPISARSEKKELVVKARVRAQRGRDSRLVA